METVNTAPAPSTTVNATQAAPQTAVETKPVQPTPAPAENLVTRVSQFKQENKDKAIPVDEPQFDINEINSIKDPEARAYAEKAYKSFQKGFNKKFEDLANIRKSLEKEKETISSWSPERVQNLLNDKNFVYAAQKLQQFQNPHQSGLSD